MRDRSAWRRRAVWVAAGLCAGVLWWRNDPGRRAIPAVVAAARHELGPVEASRVARVYVKPGDRVRAGQPLVQLDCSETDAALGVARAELQEQLAEVEAVAVAFTDEARRRRLEVETELARARAALADAKGLHEAQQAELTTLNEQLERLDRVIRNRLTNIDRLTELRARQGRLERRARYAPEMLSAWSDAAAQVRGALESLDGDDVTVRLQPLKARVETQQQRVQQILERRSRCTLTTPVDGQVSRILHFSGDAVSAGTTVATVVGSRPASVTAYLPEDNAHALEAGRPVEVRPRDRQASRTSYGVIDEIGPEIVEMPVRLWLAPDRPRYGRPIHIEVEADADLFPGELAYVHPDTAQVHAAALPDETFVAQVPDALRRLTRLEVGGLIWLPARHRFLAVSDDTGFPRANEHQPWAFTVDGDGRFDSEPLPIHGIEAISDVESVTRAPDGTIYLLSSQSRSRKGGRPIKRQWLLRAQLAGQDLTVTGKLAVYDGLLARLDAGRRAELGVTDQLDIEGMAWHAGGLLLGLKAPQDPSGQARLWRLANVDALLDQGETRAQGSDGAALSPFGKLSLPTCAAGAPGGISDLYLESDQLYVLSSLPEGAPCGSAWIVDLPLTQTAPRKLADWSGVRPEGIARGGNGELRVAFDTGDETPRFARLPEP